MCASEFVVVSAHVCAREFVVFSAHVCAGVYAVGRATFGGGADAPVPDGRGAEGLPPRRQAPRIAADFRHGLAKRRERLAGELEAEHVALDARIRKVVGEASGTMPADELLDLSNHRALPFGHRGDSPFAAQRSCSTARVARRSRSPFAPYRSPERRYLPARSSFAMASERRLSLRRQGWQWTRSSGLQEVWPSSSWR